MPVPAIVIGAGFAGLSAALALREFGIDPLVLEAGTRPGGRARTDYSLRGGGPSELGAQMVHGRTATTHAWVETWGVHLRPYPVMRRSRIVVDRRVGRFPWWAMPFHPVVGMRAALEARYGIPNDLQAYDGPDVSLEEYLRANPPRPAARRIVELLHAHVYGADPDQIGIRGPAEEDRELPEVLGYTNFRMVEGYSALAERVARSLGERIRYGREVVAVQRGPSAVRVRARIAGSGVEEEYRAPTAIVTVPLGVLKAGTIAFDPPLPPEKLDAVRTIAVADAFALHVRLAPDHPSAVLGDFAMLWGGTPSSFYRPSVGTAPPPEVITAFTVGREARRRATLPVPDLVEATRKEWESVVPSGAEWGQVEDARVHLWTNDPLFRGAYSYLPPGASLADRAALATPVDGRLFFAGEATNLHGQSATVAGAIDSGRRAAEEVHAALEAPDARPTGSG